LIEVMNMKMQMIQFVSIVHSIRMKWVKTVEIIEKIRDLEPSNISMKRREHSVEICDLRTSPIASIDKTFVQFVFSN
jgi:hypothetical protein